MVIKIGFSHLQTIALASSFELAWPQEIVRFFDVVDTSSSVSPDIVSIDCLFDRSETDSQASRTFFLTTSMILLAPIVFVAVVSLFWLARFSCTVANTTASTKRIIATSIDMAASRQMERQAREDAQLRMETNPLSASMSTSSSSGGATHSAVSRDSSIAAELDGANRRGNLPKVARSRTMFGPQPPKSSTRDLLGDRLGGVEKAPLGRVESKRLPKRPRRKPTPPRDRNNNNASAFFSGKEGKACPRDESLP